MDFSSWKARRLRVLDITDYPIHLLIVAFHVLADNYDKNLSKSICRTESVAVHGAHVIAWYTPTCLIGLIYTFKNQASHYRLARETECSLES